MDWIGTVEQQGQLLSAAARRDPAAQIPACPGWTIDDLVKHLSTTHRWCERILRERRTEMAEFDTPPESGSIDWFDAGVVRLVATMRNIAPSTPVWTFGADHTAAFWLRRQAHETTVHRVDAEQAADAGAVTAVDPALAADGIAEVLEVFVPMTAPRRATAGGTLHLHTTDTDGEWLLRFGDAEVAVEIGHAKGDAAIRGAAADIYLWLWGRNDGSSLERFGDADLQERLQLLARI